MELLLYAFEPLWGLKINFHKSETFCYGEAKTNLNKYAQIFGYNMGSFLFRYLGISMHHRKLMNKGWNYIEERFQRNWAVGGVRYYR